MSGYNELHHWPESNRDLNNATMATLACTKLLVLFGD
jgi:hypothetical protein